LQQITYYDPLASHLERLTLSLDEKSYRGFCKTFAPNIFEMR